MSEKVIFDIDQMIDLGAENPPKIYRQSLVDGDSAAHRWRVRVVRGGAEIPLDGCAVGCYVRRDIERDDGVQEPMMHIEGAVEDGCACAKFPPEVYQLGGPLIFVMRLTLTESSVVALAVLRATSAKLLSDSLYDPEGVVPSLDELLAQIGDMKAATSDARLAAQEARDTMAGAQTALADAQEAVAIAEGWANAAATAQSVPSDQQPTVRMAAAEGARRLHFEIPAGASGVYIGSEEPTDPNVQVWLKPDGAIDEDGVVVDLAPLLAVKADAVLDESARADSHRLYAQKAPMQVTLHGTEEGVTNTWIRTCGKNLFSGVWEYGTVNTSGVESDNTSVVRTGLIPVEYGKTYTFNRTVSTHQAAVREYDRNGEFLKSRGQIMAAGVAAATIGMTTEGVGYIRVVDFCGDLGTLWMMVEGSEQAAYEPYTENRVEMTIPEDAGMLYGDGVVFDTIENDVIVDGAHASRIIKRWTSVTLDGSDDEYYKATGSAFWHSLELPALAVAGNGDIGHVYSDALDTGTANGAYNGTPCVAIRPDGNLQICIEGITTDLAALRAYLAVSPITVRYAVAEPVTYMDDACTLPALGTMPDNVMGSAQTSVVYAHNTKHYIDAQVAAAVALALS